MNRQHILLLLLLTSIISIAFAEDSNSFYPTTIGKLSTEVKLFGNGAVAGLKDGEEARFQTLTFQESEYQKLKIIREELYINGKTIYPKYVLDEFNNKYVSFTITENGDFNYELVADINTSSIIYKINDYNISGDALELVQDYLKPSEKVESNSTEIMTLAKNKLTTTSFLDSLNKTILWVNDYVEYAQGTDFQKYYLLQRSAIETLLSRKGVCDEFANLAAGMLRAKGIPTRLAIGITYDGKEWGNHAWIGVYHEKNGWVPSDPTFREAGFVDATHIKFGTYTDVSLSLAKAYFPSTASVTFYTQTLPEVKVLSKEYFTEVKIKSNLSELTANKWNEVPVEVTNLTDSDLTIPVSIKESYNELIIQDKKKSIILGPNETKTITFEILPKIDLSDNQLAKGTLTFNSLSQPYLKEFTIKPGAITEGGEVVIKDITPIAHEGQLEIQIIATNYYPTEKNIDINIVDGNNLTSTEQVPGFSNKTITKDIPNYKNEAYLVTVTTPTSIFTQTIVPQTQTDIIPTQTITKTVVEQKIDATQKPDVAEVTKDNPIIIVVALIMGTAVMVFGLLWVNKRYI
jgi:transglutaminase-like putative cysteine protease